MDLYPIGSGKHANSVKPSIRVNLEQIPNEKCKKHLQLEILLVTCRMMVSSFFNVTEIKSKRIQVALGHWRSWKPRKETSPLVVY